MIHLINKTVFNSNCEAIVNTVNCVGVMGAGLALEFALRYPKLNEQYEIDCREKRVKIGEILPYKTKDYIVLNFPTKIHWKYPSKIEWIEQGLDFLKSHYKEWNVKSIAIPPLGCSNGGLSFERQVKPLIYEKLKDLDIDIFVCVDPGVAEGKEKIMIDSFNDSDRLKMCDFLKIKGKARESLLIQNKVDRFYKIFELENVGIVSYKKIFEYFYNDGCAFKNKKVNTLFDM